MDCQENRDAGDDAGPRLCFSLRGALITRFFPLLQQGVMVRTGVGCSVKLFLSEELGLSDKTIEDIQSLFLDGRPVDDLEAAVIKDGSVLALSAAMPGLVGATLRRGGTYSSFRNTITYRETSDHCSSGEGLVQVKVFNLLMAGIGPGLLGRGVYVRSVDMADFLGALPQDFWAACDGIFINGKPVTPEVLKGNAWTGGHDRVMLSIKKQQEVA